MFGMSAFFVLSSLSTAAAQEVPVPTEAEIKTCVEEAHSKFQEKTTDAVSALRGSDEKLSLCGQLAQTRDEALESEARKAREASDAADEALGDLRSKPDKIGPMIVEARSELAEHQQSYRSEHAPCTVDLYYEVVIAELEAAYQASSEGSEEFAAAQQKVESAYAAYVLAREASSHAGELRDSIEDEILQTKKLICGIYTDRGSGAGIYHPPECEEYRELAQSQCAAADLGCVMRYREK